MKSIKEQLFSYWWNKWYAKCEPETLDIGGVAKEAWKAGFEKGYEKALAYSRIADDE